MLCQKQTWYHSWAGFLWAQKPKERGASPGMRLLLCVLPVCTSQKFVPRPFLSYWNILLHLSLRPEMVPTSLQHTGQRMTDLVLPVSHQPWSTAKLPLCGPCYTAPAPASTQFIIQQLPLWCPSTFSDVLGNRYSNDPVIGGEQSPILQVIQVFRFVLENKTVPQRQRGEGQ